MTVSNLQTKSPVPAVSRSVSVATMAVLLILARSSPAQIVTQAGGCGDPLSPACTGGAGRINAASQLYVDDSGGRRQGGLPDASRDIPQEPLTDFQRLAQASTGEILPIFGRDLFRSPPSTFAPGDQVAVSPEYVVGPGDDVLLRIWGSENFNGQLTVDRSGSIYVPKAGAIHVAGLPFSQLQQEISTELSKNYRNFEVSVNLGTLRSIQVYVVGEAQRPGAYTVSSLSTMLNALFASGGPNSRGSLRHIQLRRTGSASAEFDLYDFLIDGDKSKDLRLETGDTIFIPSIGPQVAIAGSVRHRAIYELNRESTVGAVLALAGGPTATAVADHISLERIDTREIRTAHNIKLDESGRAVLLRDGDVLFVDHITAAYEQTVTIRGNLADPGRFAWHEGMKLSDIIPDKMSLLTADYWQERNRLGIPVPLFEPSVDANAPTTGSRVAAPDSTQAGLALQSGTINGPLVSGAPQQSVLPQAQPASPRNNITIPAPAIDWSYAVIERLDPETLTNVLVPFNLGKLIQDHDASQDLGLRPGDTVTILSQDDIAVAQGQRTKYVRLEGEFGSAGVYSVTPNETLADLVRRAGGLTPAAYLYGSNFSRRSAQIFQQQRLDEYIGNISTDIERAAAERSAGTLGTDSALITQQRILIDHLHQLRATGRVVLQFKPESAGDAAVPQLSLEDGDVFRVPSRPNTVSVVGAVYGQNVFLYQADRKLGDYVAMAGNPTRIADRKHAFIIRADGSVYSRDRAQGVLSNDFDSARINPGDSIVVPEKMIKPPVIRELLDYSQILSSFGLAAAAVNVLR